MLERLVIRNYAIIESLDIAFSNGLTIITGETGAGKSILLGALGLALGKRAETKLVSDDASKCIVEAHFRLEDESLKSVFEQEELDFDKHLICRREIGSGGRSRSFINDTPVSLKVMQDITGYLIELHHQHDNLALQSKPYQINVLDNISASITLLEQYKLIYTQWIHAKLELSRIQELEQTSARKKEFLQFQIDELTQARLQAGELASLEENQRMLQHAEAIDAVIHQLQNVLQNNSHSVNHQVTGLIKQLQGVVNAFTPFQEINQRLEALRVEVQDLALEASRLEGPGGNDPSKLLKTESRLNQLYTLIKKYQTKDETQLLQLFEELKKELASLSTSSETIKELENKIHQLYTKLIEAGEKLSKQRKAGAKKMIPKIIELLHELGMPNARADIEIAPTADPTPAGMDEIQFTFSANKGMSLQPIQSVASGGELSRFSLAIKSIYASEARLPTVVFDEIDTGISGEVAWRMGQIILSMSAGPQILMITHSPQIAVHANHQFHVSKITTGKKDVSSIEKLDSRQRINEIAKMLSGDPPSPAAIKNAESLLSSVKKKKEVA
ncbi:MAG TPA: DNA repair protein RecN [Saprospiraceae bacterium]|nr:DNA repair protein RecN [Saprospiraceae bacterium]